MTTIKLQIITPEKKVFSEEVDQLSITTQTGEITILPHHIPLITTLQAGELRYKQNNQEHTLAVSGGFAEVRSGSEVIILADSADYAEEIDVQKAEEAQVRAQKLMQEERQHDEIEYVTLQATIEKELNKIRIGNKYRNLPKN
jgi:F-type H+-transporting ATPase subunit epsilon